jgi:hypothetical protein
MRNDLYILRRDALTERLRSTGKRIAWSAENRKYLQDWVYSMPLSVFQARAERKFVRSSASNLSDLKMKLIGDGPSARLPQQTAR